MPGKYSNRRRLLILGEQVRIVDRATPLGVTVSMVAAIFLVVALWPHLNPSTVLIWLGTMTLAQGWRLAVSRTYRRITSPPEGITKSGRALAMSTAAAGWVWGAAGILLYVPDAAWPQALLTMVLLGLAAGSIYFLASHVFIIPTVLPLAFRTAAEGDLVHAVTALLILVFLGFVLVFSRFISKVITETLNMRYENLDLIEELRAQKAAAEKATREADAANRSKSQFLAAASHDLRQPLHALGLFAAVLEEKIRYPEVRRIVGNINASVKALESLFNELLDISKLDSGAVHPNLSQFAVQTLFDRLRADYAPMASERGLRFRVVNTRALVYSDPILLDRIVRNLVINAITYTVKGGVVVGCRRRGKKMIQVEVWDTGIGISPDQCDRIFDEFYQIGNPERDRSKGLGLGLAIVKRLQLLLKYRIQLTSIPGRGSVFRVETPFCGTVSRWRPDLEPAAVTENQLEGKFIILIDDELTIREGMQALLTEWGCTALVAGSLEEALQQLPEYAGTPDVIIADYRLRAGATGSEVIRILQTKLGSDIPGILITGDIAPDRLREFESSGYELLLKPVPPAELRALLSSMIQSQVTTA